MKKAPIKAKNESNSPLFANFLTQSGVFCNFLTRATSYAKVSFILLLNFNVFAIEFVDVEKSLNSGDITVANQWLAEIDKNSADYNKVDYIKATVALINNQLEDAEDFIEKAIKNYPHADTYNLAGGIYGMQAGAASIFSKLSYAKKSKKYLQMAHKADPTNVDYMEGLIQFNIQAPGIAGGDMDAVEPLIAKIEKLDKKKAVQLRGLFIAENDDKEVALAYITKEITANPDIKDFIYYRATLLASMKDFENAVADYSLVINSITDNNSSIRINALYQLGRLASMQNKWLEQGKDSFIEFLNIQDTTNAPPKAWATYRLGLIYQHLGNKDFAMQQFKKAMTLKPDDELKKRLKKII